MQILKLVQALILTVNATVYYMQCILCTHHPVLVYHRVFRMTEVDISVAQDGGILKTITKPGIGEITPDYGSEVGFYYVLLHVQ